MYDETSFNHFLNLVGRFDDDLITWPWGNWMRVDCFMEVMKKNNLIIVPSRMTGDPELHDENLNNIAEKYTLIYKLCEMWLYDYLYKAERDEIQKYWMEICRP